jgi:hypothetical protein
MPAHGNRSGYENKMKIYDIDVVFLRYFLLRMGDFPWLKSNKVSELSVSYRFMSIVRMFKNRSAC